MKIIIEINESELELKKAIAKGWNRRFEENITAGDVARIMDRDEILDAIPFLDNNKIKIVRIKK